MRCRALPIAVGLGACAPPPASLPSTSPPRSTPPPSRAAPKAEATPEPDQGLRDLVVAAPFGRMLDCGHDGEVDGLHCAFTVAGEARSGPAEERLRWFVTDPPGLVLAAVEWEPLREIGDASVMVAECEFDTRGRLSDVHLGAAPSITGYWYTGSVEVGRATACRFEPRPRWGTDLAAAHLLVPHRDAQRAAPEVTRTRAEAAARAREVAQRLDADELDFPAAVAAYSEEAGAKQSGGAIGTFGLDTLAPEFTFIVLGTPVGSHSDPFESAFGFHVVERQN